MVAELGSFSRAAERLGIAQPVVSAHVKALSEKFGARLFIRQGRRISLTEEGQRIYRWARDVVGRTMELEREMAESQKGIVGKAILSASMTIGSYVLPGLINAFHQQSPAGEISVRITTPVLATESIRDGDCDFGFTILDPRHDVGGLQIEKVYDEPLILVASDQIPFPIQGYNPKDLEGLPFVTAQSGSSRQAIEDTALARFSIRRRRIEMEFGHPEATKQAVRAGVGFAFMFRSSVRDELASGILKEVATPGMELRVPVYQVYRQNKQLSNFQISVMGFLAGALKDQDPFLRAAAIEGA